MQSTIVVINNIQVLLHAGERLRFAFFFLPKSHGDGSLPVCQFAMCSSGLLKPKTLLIPRHVCHLLWQCSLYVLHHFSWENKPLSYCTAVECLVVYVGQQSEDRNNFSWAVTYGMWSSFFFLTWKSSVTNVSRRHLRFVKQKPNVYFYL